MVTFSAANPLAAYSVFLPVLTETFGWSRGAVSLALSINLLLGGIVGFAVGAIADRYGPRVPLVVTLVLTGVGFALVSAVDALWQLYLVVGVVGGCGTSGFYVLATATAARWFQARRGLAVGIVLFGFSAGYMSGGPLAAFLIAHTGWRTAYLLIGLGAALIGGLASLVVRFPDPSGAPIVGVRASGAPSSASGAPVRRTDGGGPAAGERLADGGMDLRRALGDPRLWLLTTSWFLFGTVLMMVTVHCVSYAHDRGIALEVAALAVTAYGVGAMVGRLSFGLAVDRFGNQFTMACGFVIQVAALFLLLAAEAPGPVVVLVGLFGFGVMGADTVVAKAIPDVFGVRALGAILGVLSVGWRTGAALGPAAAGFLRDVTGSYTLPFALGPVMLGVGFALFIVVSRHRGPRARGARAGT